MFQASDKHLVSKIMQMNKSTPKKMFKGTVMNFLKLGAMLTFALTFSALHAEESTSPTALNFISFTALPDQGVEIHLTFSDTPPRPTASTTSNPARITLDLPKVKNNLPWSLPLPIEVGPANTVSAIEASGRTRVVVNLNQLAEYQTRTQGNSIFLTIENTKKSGVPAVAETKTPEQPKKEETPVPEQPAPTPPAATQQANGQVALEDINFVALPGDRALVNLKFTGTPPKPASFTIDDPARIALDFPKTANKLSWRNRNIGIGLARSVTVVEAGGRTRVVINLVKLLPYETRVEGQTVSVTLKSEATTPAPQNATSMPMQAEAAPYSIEDIDFRRGDNGEGRVIVTLSDPSMPVDTREAGGKIFVDFANASLPEKLHQRLDVMDFATPVQFVDTSSSDHQVQMTITPTGYYDFLAFQSENTLTIEVKPLTKEEKEGLKKTDTVYTGEKLSLNFQDIEVRAVLQLLADFTGLNMVTSDTVQGNLTLRLKNVPWDQALDIILKTKGLGMRRTGDVLMIAPGEEIAAREKLELESKKQVEELAPLQSELIQINYAKASELAGLLKSQDNTLLSERGKVTVDERTNTLLILDTSDRLANIRKLVSKLDVPIRQVLIESRIVIASNDFAKDLGVRFGVTGVRQTSNRLFMSSGTIGSTDTMVGSALDNISSTGQPSPISIPTGDGGYPQRLNVNLPVTGSAGSFALSILGANTLLDLELSALQSEGRGEVISSPKVITSNQKEAIIKQGTEIPYQESTSSGATSVSFKDAVLSLKVTPHITPDDRIRMDLDVSKDSIGQRLSTPGGGEIPTIDTRQISTQVLVQSGDTIVLGGIHEQEKRKDVTKIPFFGDLPFIGALFRTKRELDNNRELLIFVTPKILKEDITLK